MRGIDGREVLKQIRADESLKVIPVVVLKISGHDPDILESLGLEADSYVVKPVERINRLTLTFFKVVREINNFWVRVVALPPE